MRVVEYEIDPNKQDCLCLLDNHDKRHHHYGSRDTTEDDTKKLKTRSIGIHAMPPTSQIHYR
jgi:hypothetical protein